MIKKEMCETTGSVMSPVGTNIRFNQGYWSNVHIF